MKLYHYTTWTGGIVRLRRHVHVSNNYGWGNTTTLTEWPKLLFLTSDPHWERSIQAYNRAGHHEKCGSCPETYEQLGIPCWKFEVEVDQDTLKAAVDTRLMINDKWEEMLVDALSLGSDVTKWWVGTQPIAIEKSYKWKEGRWHEVNV